MQAITRRIKWVMVVSGLLTTTMLYAAFAPEAALERTFGDSLSGPLADIVVRSWGVLIAMVGVLLIYGAVRPQHRRLALVVGVVSKLAFIGFVLSAGGEYIDTVGTAVAVDGVSVLVFVLYLAGNRRQRYVAWEVNVG